MREAHKRGELVLGEPFWVHRIDRGTRETMQRQARNMRCNLLKFLDKKFALGKFSVSAVERHDAFGGYDIFVTYYGEAVDKARKTRWKNQRRKRS